MFNYINATREELIQFLITEHKHQYEDVIHLPIEKLKILASIGDSPDLENANFYHFSPIVTLVLSILFFILQNITLGVIFFILVPVSLFIVFMIDKNKKMELFNKL